MWTNMCRSHLAGKRCLFLLPARRLLPYTYTPVPSTLHLIWIKVPGWSKLCRHQCLWSLNSPTAQCLNHSDLLRADAERLCLSVPRPRSCGCWMFPGWSSTQRWTPLCLSLLYTSPTLNGIIAKSLVVFQGKIIIDQTGPANFHVINRGRKTSSGMRTMWMKNI